MSKRQTVYTLVLIAILGCGVGDIASAHGGIYGGYNGFGYDGYITTDRQIPYFAQHPPVYYSYVVPRTYGHSPYAYRSNVRTPNPRHSRPPLILRNHHIRKSSKAIADQATDKTASNTRPVESWVVVPLVIENPYVTSAGSIAGK